MKDQLIQAINAFSNLYPDYQIEYIYLWTINDNNVTYKINGSKGTTEIHDKITIDL